MADSQEPAPIEQASMPVAAPKTASEPASEPPVLATWASLVSGAGLAWTAPERSEQNQICTWKNGAKTLTLYLCESHDYKPDIVGLWKWLYS